MRRAISSERRKQLIALVVLLALAGFAVAGPTGLLAWSENATALEQREQEIAKLSAERDALRNRVKLLDPEATDPDLASELVREIPFAARTSLLVFDLKVVVLAAIFVYAFFRFTWSIRQYSVGVLLVAAAPEAAAIIDDTQRQRFAEPRREPVGLDPGARGVIGAGEPFGQPFGRDDVKRDRLCVRR